MKPMILLLGLVMFSCGEEEKEHSGQLGSCMQAVLGDSKLCTNFSYKATSKDDPKESSVETMRQSCEAASGIWSATSSCTSSGSMGSCSYESKDDNVTIGAVAYYSGASMTNTIVKLSCQGVSGEYTTQQQ